MVMGSHKCLVPGHMDAKIGDQLFFLEGGKTPFVLRARNSQARSPKEYEIVGDSYIRDMMDGNRLPRYYYNHGALTWEKILLV